MTSIRRAPVATASPLAAVALAVALLGGCKNKQPAAAQPELPSADQVAAARAAHAAQGDRLVGEVVEANERLAVVSGIDATALQKGDTVNFIDVAANRVIGIGTFTEPGTEGRIVVEVGPNERAPRQGDLCVKLK